MTGYPSIDKPWLKYYSNEAINTPVPSCTAYEFIWENNIDHLSNTAINYFGRTITYQELFDNIEHSASAFTAIGVKAGSIVVMSTVTTPETLYAFYALNRLGAIPNMVDPRTNVEGIREYIREVNCEIALTIDVAYSKMKEAVIDTNVKKIIVISPADSMPSVKKVLYSLKMRSPKRDEKCLTWDSFIINGADTKPALVPYEKNRCCVIVHTGGTTGKPKGVMLSNENVNAAVLQCQLMGFTLSRDQRWLGVMPPFIAYGIGNGFHFPLRIGMTLIIIPVFDPNKYDRLLVKHHPSHIVGVPSHYGVVIHSRRLRKFDMSFLLSPIVGGDATDVSYEKEINRFLRSHNCPTNLIKGYGMTEISAAVCVSAKESFNKLGSVGIPYIFSVMSVFNPDTGEEMKYNEIGEICMQGPHVMLGYYHDPEETANILRKHEDGSVWLHSGDLGYIDEDGCVFIQGRIKRVIIRHDGFKVFPSFIEKVVMTHPAVKQCCSVGAKDTSHSQGRLPVVFVALRDKKTDKVELEAALDELCKRELPEYAQPVSWHFIDNIPLTPIGKMDYRALEEILL